MTDIDKFKQFLEILTNHEATRIKTYYHDMSGALIDNKELNFYLEVFDDKYHNVYFSFNYITALDGSVIRESLPVFKTTDIKFIRPAIEQIINYLDFTLYEYKGFANNAMFDYIEIFKKFLRNEEIPPDYTIVDGDYNFELYNIHDEQLACIEKDRIVTIKNSNFQYQSPINLVSIDIHTDSNQTIKFHIPRCSLSDYPLLQPEKKILTAKEVNSFNDVINGIVEFNNVEGNQLKKLALYFKMEEQIDKGDEVVKKIKI